MEQKKGNFKPGQRGNFKPRGDRKNFDRRPRRHEEVEEKVWVPKTALGKDVLAKKYSNLDEVIASGNKIMEGEITDFLEPSLGQDFINVGQAKGKFGGGKRKISKPTQKITKEGSVMSFAMISITGNRDRKSVV